MKKLLVVSLIVGLVGRIKTDVLKRRLYGTEQDRYKGKCYCTYI